MRSTFRMRGILILAALFMAAAFTSCRSVPRPKTEKHYDRALAKLLPGGRIFQNDLGANERLQVRAAFLNDSQIVVEDHYGRLTVLDRKSLKPEWYFERLKGTLQFPPAVSANTMALVSHNVLFTLDRWRGTELRGPLPLNFVPAAGPAISDDTAYFPAEVAGQGAFTLVTLDLQTGIPGWGLSTRSPITSRPLLGGTADRPELYFVSWNKGVFDVPAVSATEDRPSPSWSRESHGKNLIQPVLGGGMLLVASDQGVLWARDAVTGEVDWEHMAGKSITHAPWISGDQVYYQTGDTFHALDANTGKEKWSVTFKEPVQFIVRRPEAVYVHSKSGKVIALDLTNGSKLRAVHFHRWMRFLANPMDSVFYMVSPDGFLFAVDTPL